MEYKGYLLVDMQGNDLYWMIMDGLDYIQVRPFFSADEAKRYIDGMV